MQDLDFRRKRKKPAHKPRKKSGTGNLRFEDRRQKLRFENGKSRAVNIRELIKWTVEIVLTCLVAVFLVLAFGCRVSNAGDSMSHALENGDIVLVNRFLYNIKDPSRGDVIAFRPNGNENVHYSIKRIVGLPGETVQIVDGNVYIDGEEMKDHIYVSEISYAGIAEEPVELGEEEYFVIGDNAGASDDSRTASIGNVSLDDIYGKVWFAADFGDNFGFVKD